MLTSLSISPTGSLLLLEIGLPISCLNYSTISVFRLQRVVNTLTKIGPAVLNGGFSTLLAFILLSTSQSYIFLSFFKIFFLICVFGLYHGLIVLPVMLAVAGPVHQVRDGTQDDADNNDDTVQVQAIVSSDDNELFQLSDIDEYDGLLE